MTFISTVPEDEATGEVAEMYQRTKEALGYLPNYTLAFSARPPVYAAWSRLIAAIRGNMDPRRYELATMGAARALRSTYCLLAHGEKLLELGSPESEVRSISDPGTWGDLDEKDRAIVEFASKVVEAAFSISDSDVERLRGLGLDDAEIFDVAAAAAARSFFSKLVDATGTHADARFNETMSGLVEYLSVGRPVAEA